MAGVPENGIEYPNLIEAGAGERFDTDVVVVGTGAGGAPVARRLREAGHDVMMVEEGGLHRTASFTTDQLAGARRLYRDGGTSMIMGRPPIMFAEGRCVGGSTVINGGMAWRTPEPVLARWSGELGLDHTDEVSMRPYLDEAEQILHVEHQRPDTFGRNDELFVQGARRMGWEPRDNPRNMHRCMGLNNCALGCPTGAKQSMLVTEVPRALAAGATLLTGARVDRVIFEGRRAVGVSGRFVDDKGRGKRRFTVRASLVVLAAGARHTPGIALRSRLRIKGIGHGLHTHPNAKVVGLFDERIDPWIGAHQSHQVHDFLREGILMAYAAVPPGILAVGIPGFGDAHGHRMSEYNNMLIAGCLVDDTGQGRVRLGPDRQPWMSFRLSDRDTENIHRGVRMLSEMMFAAGARKVLLPFGDLLELDSADNLGLIDRRPRVTSNIELMTVHIMSSMRMAARAADGPCDGWGRVRGTGGLVVADASAVPSSVGVNPMGTIVALALRNSARWAEDLGRGEHAAV